MGSNHKLSVAFIDTEQLKKNITTTVKIVLSDCMWAKKKWSLNGRGLKSMIRLLLGHDQVVFKDRWSLTGGHKDRFHCTYVYWI